MHLNKPFKLFPRACFPRFGHPALAAFLRQEPHRADLHPVADRLEHIVENQEPQADPGEGFHLHPGPAFHRHFHPEPGPAPGGIPVLLHLDRVKDQRVGQRV